MHAQTANADNHTSRADKNTRRKPSKALAKAKIRRYKFAPPRYWAVVFSVILAAAVCVALYFLRDYGIVLVRPSATMEAGAPLPDPAVFFYYEYPPESLLLDTDGADTRVAGEYEVRLWIGKKSFTSRLIVIDTTAPLIFTKSLAALPGESLAPELFVESVADCSTPVSWSFAKAPATETAGERTVIIRGTDTFGNFSDAEAALTVLEGTTNAKTPMGEPPVFVSDTQGHSVVLIDFDRSLLSVPGVYGAALLIDGRLIPASITVVDVTPPVFSGIKTRQINFNGEISYRDGVSAYDEVDGEVRFTVDASAVRMDTAGWYPVIYRATDKAGNVAEETGYVSVVPRTNIYRSDRISAAVDLSGVTQEVAYALADEVLAGLHLDGLSTRQKVYAIYAYVKNTLFYVHDTENLDEYLVFYRSVKARRADCYAYYATYAVLLTRAGIKNMHIWRLGGTSNHHWNLIYMPPEEGEVEGWYHSDTVFYGVSGDRRLFTEKQAQNFTRQRPLVFATYVYDHALFPEVVWDLS